MRVVALTFHDVVPDSTRAPAVGEPFYQVTARELEQLLSRLRRLGYQTASSRDFQAWQHGAASLPARTVVLTFDDGYASHFELVVPLLLRYRFGGTFFIPTDLVGRPGYMTWEQLRKLVFLGMEIGSHGQSHQPLTQLPREQMRADLLHSKRLLEDTLGVAIRALAIPRGFWNRTVADATKQAGYEAVWLSHIGTNGRDTNPLTLRRVVVRRPFSEERLVAMVEGWQPTFWWATSQQRLIRLLKRVLGVYRYEQLKRTLMPQA